MAWDEEIFQRIGDAYDLVFAAEVRRTEEQADFAMRALGLRPGQRVLDVGCGPGRHCLALARRGLVVTGVDRDPGLLALARQRARAAGLSVQWIAADARHLPRIGPFHGALCMFATWGHAADPAQNQRVLAGVAERLLPGGRFLLDVPNLAWLQAHPRGQVLSVTGGTAVRETRRFDPATRELHLQWRVRQRGRAPWTSEVRYRVYGLEEMEWLLASAGLVLEAAYGDFDGSALTAASPRCLIVARRPVLPALPPGPSAGGSDARRRPG
jgi:SAM-dependent methyltransferase